MKHSRTRSTTEKEDAVHAHETFIILCRPELAERPVGKVRCASNVQLVSTQEAKSAPKNSQWDVRGFQVNYTENSMRQW